jgi:hypothetical protein
MSWIESQFPKLVGRHRVTSPEDDRYNCIAWSVHDQTEWWSHLPGYKWPAQRSPRIESLIAVFSSLGFEVCTSAAKEVGFEKVALFARDGMWQHACRQLPSGVWVSKLGPDEDIEHDAPEHLCGESYGDLHCVMRRKADTGGKANAQKAKTQKRN